MISPGGTVYVVSSDGGVTGPRGCLTPTKDRLGYVRVRFNNNNGYILVHRLVAEAFIPNPEGKPEVNHIDGDKSNNSVDNLEWVTKSENMRHAAAVGLVKVPDQVGENHSRAILSEEDVRSIRRLYAAGGYRQWELADLFGVTHANVGAIVTGRSWKHI